MENGGGGGELAIRAGFFFCNFPKLVLQDNEYIMLKCIHVCLMNLCGEQGLDVIEDS